MSPRGDWRRSVSQPKPVPSVTTPPLTHYGLLCPAASGHRVSLIRRHLDARLVIAFGGGISPDTLLPLPDARAILVGWSGSGAVVGRLEQSIRTGQPAL